MVVVKAFRTVRSVFGVFRHFYFVSLTHSQTPTLDQVRALVKKRIGKVSRERKLTRSAARNFVDHARSQMQRKNVTMIFSHTK